MTMSQTATASATTSELAVIIVSHGSAEWLGPCLASLFEHAGELSLDVVIVENGESSSTNELVQARFPTVRVLECKNRGFAHANNVGLRAVSAPLVLFLNPDTEVIDGTLSGLVHAMESRPELGLVGVRQVTADGELWPTIRRFPNAARSLFEALGVESLPWQPSWLGERELDLSKYEHEQECDWTSGSFMLARRSAIDAAGPMDERFFLYCEEPDLCLRIKRAGWSIRHLPSLTIVHHAGRGRWNEALAAQEAYARRQYMEKHYSRLHLAAGLAAMSLGLSLRAIFGGRDRAQNRRRRAANRAALAVLLHLRPPPFGHPPGRAAGNSG
jgi:GT2 family glycosyltransferase